MDNLSNISVIKDVLARHNFTFSKALGQNFLVNPSVCPKIAEMGNAKKGFGIIEIGTGIGVLTNELAKRKSQEVAESTAALEERQKDLDVKKSELDEIISETKQEEEKLRDKAKELETKIEPRLLQSFKRIRKNSRNGLGIVYVQRDACGGCFNKIPPQRQLDIRSRKKIIVCEYCGRIMIDPELAGITPEQKVEVVKEKPVRAKRKIVHIGSDN